MNKYSIDGFYIYQDRRGDLSGEIDVNSEGLFESIIRDHMSMFPDQMIKGSFRETDKLTQLNFFKFPPTYNLANLIYRLEKPKSDILSGKYTGNWSALPYKLQMSEDMNLIIARTDTTICNISDYAELVLKQK